MSEIVYVAGKDYEEGTYYLKRIRAELAPTKPGSTGPLWHDIHDTYGWEGYGVVYQTEKEARDVLWRLVSEDFGSLGRLMNRIQAGEFHVSDDAGDEVADDQGK